MPARTYRVAILQGVLENEPQNEREIDPAMQLPLMPKGVEHIISLSLCRCSCSMQLPLMPKGVEHYRRIRAGDVGTDAITSDAERR